MTNETQSGWRARLVRFPETPFFPNFITGRILINTMMLGPGTYPAALQALGPEMMR